MRENAPFQVAVRAANRPRGKWHLLAWRTSARTICDQLTRDWETAPRGTLDPRDICANCLRATP